MPRRARVVVGGWCYHVVSRGNNRATVFHEPSDFHSFLDLIDRAQQQLPVDLLAACLMPNHFHVVLRPREPADLGRWVHWLLTSHSSRHHRRQESTGRIWQGRFKSFAIQDDRHLVTVLRYVERNALRAGLVTHAEEWPWGSLAWRTGLAWGPSLCPPPVPLPGNWLMYVNEPQSRKEIQELRTCAARQWPFGDEKWVTEAASQLQLAPSLRPCGRPRKAGNQ